MIDAGSLVCSLQMPSFSFGFVACLVCVVSCMSYLILFVFSVSKTSDLCCRALSVGC